ncbi:MAG: hypothetical protein M1352_00195 [Patescibacteria group bacterium]|nr:hypothetical protein [Patescibacteria group bacterium]
MIKFLIHSLLVLAAILAGIFLSFYYSRIIDFVKNSAPVAGVGENTRLKIESPVFSFDQAPLESQKAQITALFGGVFWQSRTASQAAEIKSPVSLAQGEEISTGDNGGVTILFPAGQTVSLEADTKVNLIQTLPKNLVFEQSLGSAIYLNTEVEPISIKAASLLTTLALGKIKISVSPSLPQIIIAVQDGQATAAYNNQQNVTQVKKINPGQTAVYNTIFRTFIFE